MSIIGEAITRVNERIASLDADAITSLETTAQLEQADWLTMGDMPSRMMLAGLVDADAAQSLHIIHTNYFHDASLAQRIVFLQVIQEYLGRTVGR